MSKGTQTRETILGKAIELASELGLEGLSIGSLAKAVGLSKSGLFAHFNSKENLQLGVLEAYAEQVIAEVIGPALREPRGIPRIRALFDLWIAWTTSGAVPGGCLFAASAFEFDDRPGTVRKFLVQTQKDWIDTLTGAARIAIQEGQFHTGLDPRQFAFEWEAIFLGSHFFHRLLGDPKADERTRKAFDELLSRAARPSDG